MVVVDVVVGTTIVLVLAGGAEVIRQVHAALILLSGFGIIHDGRGCARFFTVGPAVQPAYPVVS